MQRTDRSHAEPTSKRRSLSGRCWRSIAVGLAVSSAIQAPGLYLASLAVDDGRLAPYLRAASYLPLALFLVASVRLAIRAWALLISPAPREQLPKLLFLGAAVALALAAVPFRADLHHRKIFTVIERANPLIDAVEKYRRTEGELPQSMDDLLPVYLGELPDVPELRYHRGREGGWHLTVSSSGRGLGSNHLLYRPLQEYPPLTLRYGRWAWILDWW